MAAQKYTARSYRPYFVNGGPEPLAILIRMRGRWGAKWLFLPERQITAQNLDAGFRERVRYRSEQRRIGIRACPVCEHEPIACRTRGTV